MSINVPGRPSWGAFAEVPEHGLAFYLNGLVTNLSSAATETANISASDMGGMVVLDLQNHTVIIWTTCSLRNTRAPYIQIIHV